MPARPRPDVDRALLLGINETTERPAPRTDCAIAGTVPSLTIAAHPFAERAGERLRLGHGVVEVSRVAPDFLRPGHAIGLPLADSFVSRKPLRFAATAAGAVHLEVPEGAMAVRVDGRAVEREITIDAAQVARGVPIALGERVLLVLHLAAATEEEGGPDPLMIGHSLGIERVRQVVARVADLDVPVLVRGETGSGKELVARALHQGSRRRAGPFVSVNLGAIPKELAAAELFGAVRGAYTGATRDRDGLFRAAHGGTLFLDEVGEAPPEVQVMLLRVLETGELYPVGGGAPVPTDVRVIAATDADLEEQIRAGRFKAPLLHRLAGYEVRVPPLRERRDDIGPLLVHFARTELQATGEAHRLRPEDPRAEPWLGADLASTLVRYRWPGNIRQLRNVTRQIVIASRGAPQLSLEPQLAADLEAAGASPETAPAAAPAPEPAAAPRPRRRPADVSEAELLEALRAAAWDLRAAADRLGIARPSIYDLVERHPRLHIARDLDAAEIRRAFDDCGGDVDAMVGRLQVSRRALQRRLRELDLGQRHE